jgi:hypothetical protein
MRRMNLRPQLRPCAHQKSSVGQIVFSCGISCASSPTSCSVQQSLTSPAGSCSTPWRLDIDKRAGAVFAGDDLATSDKARQRTLANRQKPCGGERRKCERLNSLTWATDMAGPPIRGTQLDDYRGRADCKGGCPDRTTSESLISPLRRVRKRLDNVLDFRRQGLWTARPVQR